MKRPIGYGKCSSHNQPNRFSRTENGHMSAGLGGALGRVVDAMEAHQIPTVTTKTLRDLLTADRVDVTDEMVEAAAEEMWPHGGTLEQHRKMRNALKAALHYAHPVEAKPVNREAIEEIIAVTVLHYGCADDVRMVNDSDLQSLNEGTDAVLALFGGDAK